jgi:predicted metal-dependent HD superfamily phosphohydrolase
VLISTVHHFIIATARHLPRTTHPDELWFLDMDLAILGSEPPAYNRYARAIRREYQMFQDEVYRVGRQRVLEGLLARPHIYQTAYCMVRLEEQARQNIWHELQTL